MQKTERIAPAYSGCLSKVVFASIIAIFVWCNVFGQTKAQQDSIAKEQAKVNKFIDSVRSKTSIKEFSEFLYEKVSAKAFNEGKFGELWSIFIQAKYDEWMQRKKQPKN